MQFVSTALGGLTFLENSNRMFGMTLCGLREARRKLELETASYYHTAARDRAITAMAFMEGERVHVESQPGPDVSDRDAVTVVQDAELSRDAAVFRHWRLLPLGVCGMNVALSYYYPHVIQFWTNFGRSFSRKQMKESYHWDFWNVI